MIWFVCCPRPYQPKARSGLVKQDSHYILFQKLQGKISLGKDEANNDNHPDETKLSSLLAPIPNRVTRKNTVTATVYIHTIHGIVHISERFMHGVLFIIRNWSIWKSQLSFLKILIPFSIFLHFRLRTVTFHSISPRI